MIMTDAINLPALNINPIRKKRKKANVLAVYPKFIWKKKWNIKYSIDQKYNTGYMYYILLSLVDHNTETLDYLSIIMIINVTFRIKQY